MALTLLTDMDAPAWDVDVLRTAVGAAGIALWSWDTGSGAVVLDDHAHDLWGIPRGRTVSFEDLSACMHPADINRVRTALEATRSAPGAYEIDFRILRGDGIRWVSARGQGGERGIVGRVLFAIFLDVTKRRQAEEAQEMLADEMGHRIKNLLAIASALTTVAARSTSTTAEMARDLAQRLAALGRAHDLVRPAPGQADAKASLDDLLAVLLAPYRGKGVGADCVRVAIPKLPVGALSATTMALIVHELATNSIKYGALSAAAGQLGVSCVADAEDVVLSWAERGGPPVSAPTGPSGFGSRMIAQSVLGQLGGSIAYDWAASGVVVTLRMHRSRLAL